ncbi:MAG: FtsQ-type POTRA domain-containing protein [Acidimicrobiales bacterium]
MSRRGSNETVASFVEETKRATRRRLRPLTTVLVGVGLLVTALVLGGQWVLHRSYFEVQHVSVVGVHHERVSQVLAVSGLEAHPAMIDVSVSSVEQKLSTFPWIQSVTLTKHWPSTVILSVHESAAVAVAYGSGHALEYVDARGRDLGPAPLTVNLPTLTYVNASKNTWPFERAGRSAAFVASKLPRAFASQVDQVSEDASGSVTLKMTTPVSFILGAPTQLEAKFVAIASVIAHSTLRAGDVINVTVPDELAVSGPPPS